jgi:hypothetical protein
MWYENLVKNTDFLYQIESSFAYLCDLFCQVATLKESVDPTN